MNVSLMNGQRAIIGHSVEAKRLSQGNRKTSLGTLTAGIAFRTCQPEAVSKSTDNLASALNSLCELYFNAMASIDFLRFASLCILLAGAETLHGIARTVLLAPRIGNALAIKLSVVTGTLLAFGLCYFLVPGIGAVGIGAHLLLGFGLSGFMAAFDMAIGRLVMHLKWARILRDFNPRSGNYLSIGLGLLALSPGVVWWLRSGVTS